MQNKTNAGNAWPYGAAELMGLYAALPEASRGWYGIFHGTWFLHRQPLPGRSFFERQGRTQTHP